MEMQMTTTPAQGSPRPAPPRFFAHRQPPERRAFGSFVTPGLVSIGQPAPGLRAACVIIRAIVDEVSGILDGSHSPQTHRRAVVHRRQIAMYVAHVVLRMSMTDIGVAFGRDRTTVAHSCGVVEDRRDDPAYDRFVAHVERLTMAVFQLEAPADGA
jgi:hypothetical protein